MLTQFALTIWLLLAGPTTNSGTEFPTSWQGVWRGPGISRSVGGPAQNLTMELHVAATDDPMRFTWQIVYEENGKRQVRPYELLTIDAEKGKYLIDEKNSIRIDSTYIDGALYSQFDVGQVRITASYRLDGDRIIVEILASDPKSPTASGGEGNVPRVDSFPTKALQRAVLEHRE